MSITKEQLAEMQERIERSRYIPLAPLKAKPPTKKVGRKSRETNQLAILKEKIRPTEAQEHKELVKWLKITYPNVIFNTDMSGIKLPMGLAIKCASLRSHRAMPDLQIMKACIGYNGCFIELKRSGEKLFKKDGVTYVSEHIKEQAEVIEKLQKEGYFATFCIGLEDAKSTIFSYLTNTK
jgi:hypothetical protein